MQFEKVSIGGVDLIAPAGFLESEFVKKGRCGPSNGSALELIVPESILGSCVTWACKTHDYGYSLAGNTAEKEMLDIQFFANGYRILKAKSRNRFMFFCRAVVMTWYLIAVLFFGDNRIGKTKS